MLYWYIYIYISFSQLSQLYDKQRELQLKDQQRERDKHKHVEMLVSYNIYTWCDGRRRMDEYKSFNVIYQAIYFRLIWYIQYACVTVCWYVCPSLYMYDVCTMMISGTRTCSCSVGQSYYFDNMHIISHFFLMISRRRKK